METLREIEMTGNGGKQGATRAVRNLGRALGWGFKLAEETASKLWEFALDVSYWVVDFLMDLIMG